MSDINVEYVEPGFLLDADEKAQYMPSRQKGMVPVVRVEAVVEKLHEWNTLVLGGTALVWEIQQLLSALEVKG